MNGKKYRHRRTLIVGEVRSGKTACTLRVFRSLRKTCQGPFCVLDLAPEELNGVGGKLPLSEEEKDGVIYLSPLIVPPRLRGKSEEEVQRPAGENRERIDQIFRTPQAPESRSYSSTTSPYIFTRAARSNSGSRWKEFPPSS